MMVGTTRNIDTVDSVDISCFYSHIRTKRNTCLALSLSRSC